MVIFLTNATLQVDQKYGSILLSFEQKGGTFWGIMRYATTNPLWSHHIIHTGIRNSPLPSFENHVFTSQKTKEFPWTQPSWFPKPHFPSDNTGGVSSGSMQGKWQNNTQWTGTIELKRHNIVKEVRKHYLHIFLQKIYLSHLPGEFWRKNSSMSPWNSDTFPRSKSC